MKFRYLSLLLAVSSATIAAAAQTTSPNATGRSKQTEQVDFDAELAVAKRELAEMGRRYRDKHPAMVVQHQKIKRLEKAVAMRQAGSKTEQAEQTKQVDFAAELTVAKQELAEMGRRYRDKHPAMVVQSQKIKRLEKAVATQQADSAPVAK